ncbi:MAG: sulfotransferase domain-containing protein [Alphaproteobacteria bacterium]|nr:sulfotransferase domain-containing protein [Alphaproteobacteria bacterium]
MTQAQKGCEDGIIWIASYPKSGNTWLRLLLGNYFYAKDAPLTINTIQKVIKGDVSAALYRPVCKDKGWSFKKSIDDVTKREYFMRAYIRSAAGTPFLKTHSCFHVQEGVPYFAEGYTKGFICIVRDPRDVACSYARHLGVDIDGALERMSNKKYAVISDEGKSEFISSWDAHVNSFAQTGFPTMVIRYEDLLNNTKQVFGSVIQNLTGGVDEAKLDFAVEHSDFAVLQSQEKQEGFLEASSKNDRFFERGRAGGWKDTLSAKQAKAVEERFGKVMKNLKYL